MGSYVSSTMEERQAMLQAMGRVIRTKKDSGIIVLIDDRYLTPLYRSLFPPHYRHALCVRDNLRLETLIRAFWQKRSEQ